jgi:O-antigen/teichoic acid export membrane protein
MIKYAYPIMFTGVAGMTNEMFSRLTLEWWLPKGFYPGRSEEHALGVFGACYKFAVLMNLAVQAFRFAAEPFFFSNAADKNSPELFAKINHYFVLVCCILLFGVSINLDILKHFTGKEYWEGLSIVPILLVAYLFLGVYYNLTVWFKLTDRTYYGTIITIGGAVVTIGLNYILIPLAGYTGSSWAALICYFSMSAACYLLGQKYYPIPYAVGKAILYILVTVLLIYGIDKIVIENQFIATTFHILMLVLYVTVVFLFERKGLRQALA